MKKANYWYLGYSGLAGLTCYWNSLNCFPMTFRDSETKRTLHHSWVTCSVCFQGQVMKILTLLFLAATLAGAHLHSIFLSLSYSMLLAFLLHVKGLFSTHRCISFHLRIYTHLIHEIYPLRISLYTQRHLAMKVFQNLPFCCLPTVRCTTCHSSINKCQFPQWLLFENLQYNESCL